MNKITQLAYIRVDGGQLVGVRRVERLEAASDSPFCNNCLFGFLRVHDLLIVRTAVQAYGAVALDRMRTLGKPKIDFDQSDRSAFGFYFVDIRAYAFFVIEPATFINSSRKLPDTAAMLAKAATAIAKSRPRGPGNGFGGLLPCAPTPQ